MGSGKYIDAPRPEDIIGPHDVGEKQLSLGASPFPDHDSRRRSGTGPAAATIPNKVDGAQIRSRSPSPFGSLDRHRSV